MKLSKVTFKKTITEATLWLLFLFFCTLIGYLQGIKPNFKVADYLVKPTEIHILTISDHFFPLEIIREIEKLTHTKISVSIIQDWDHLKIQLIASPSPEIIFLPSHWALALQKEMILNSDPAIRSTVSKIVSPDFTVENDFFIPTYWAKLSFMKTSNADKTISLLNDPDLFLSYNEHLKETKQNLAFLKHDFHVLKMNLWFKKNAEESADAVLSTHILNSKMPTWKKTSYPDSFYVLGFALSKVNPNFKQSMKVLEHYHSIDIQTHLLESVQFASTLKNIDESTLPNEIKSSYLRTLDFNKMIILKNKDTDAAAKAKELTGSFL